MRLPALLAVAFGVPALALQRRDDEYKGNGKPYEDPADKGGRMLTVSLLSSFAATRPLSPTAHQNAQHAAKLSWTNPGPKNPKLNSSPADQMDM